MHKKLFLYLITFCLSWQTFSQDFEREKYASIPEYCTGEQIAMFRTELLLFLNTLPQWKVRPDLEKQINFEDSDIQIYGYKEFPILQIDFRYTFPSNRKKGYHYQAHYTYTNKIKFKKVDVVIDPGTTPYIKS